jgi:hydroxyacylglutathione hydrolase
MSVLEIVRIPVLDDNYIWLVHDPASKATVVVDPAEADPVLKVAAQRGWSIDQIWNTHWHPDHVGGNVAIKAATGACIAGPSGEADRIPGIDIALSQGDQVNIGAHRANVLEMPGHTAGHIVFHLAEEAVLFSGDTLFAMGCGRLFEGSAAQMFANMRRLAALPAHTRVYCAHEYTQSNGRFAQFVEPKNAEIATRMRAVDDARAAGRATIPTTMGEELATNPFLRANTEILFAERRAAKDNFAG